MTCAEKYWVLKKPRLDTIQVNSGNTVHQGRRDKSNRRCYGSWLLDILNPTRLLILQQGIKWLFTERNIL